ncbi:hypothetical protein GCM10010307_53130 [Streptomyces vastus]|uniref:Uncharacterized protein n=1 Tax=Streptomyces vastus TaxID=285451 RepID=A0ABN3RCS3_9ACTN
MRRLREEMFGQADERLAAVLADAVARDELRAGVEERARDLMARILGPLLFQRFMLGTGSTRTRRPRRSMPRSRPGSPRGDR